MTEEVTNPQESPVETPSEPTGNPVEEAFKDAVRVGDIEVPSKFVSDGKLNSEALLKSYTEMEAKQGTQSHVSIDENWKPSINKEGFTEGQMSEVEPKIESVRQVALSLGASQEQAQKLADDAVTAVKQEIEDMGRQNAEFIKLVGGDAKYREKINDISAWLKTKGISSSTEEEWKLAKDIAATPVGFRLFEALKNSQEGAVGMTQSQTESTKPQPANQAEFMKFVNSNPDWAKSKEVLEGKFKDAAASYYEKAHRGDPDGDFAKDLAQLKGAFSKGI